MSASSGWQGGCQGGARMSDGSVNRLVEVSQYHRELMVEQICTILQKARPNGPSAIVKQIPSLARRVEATLYFNSKSLAEYSNRFTLEERMKAIASKSIRHNKRRRGTPNSSSNDLRKLDKNERKRAILNSNSAYGTDTESDTQEEGIVACVSVGGERKIAFNFSSSSRASRLPRSSSSSSTSSLKAGLSGDVVGSSSSSSGTYASCTNSNCNFSISFANDINLPPRGGGEPQDDDDDICDEDDYSSGSEDELDDVDNDCGLAQGRASEGADLQTNRLRLIYKLLDELLDQPKEDQVAIRNLMLDLQNSVVTYLAMGSNDMERHRRKVAEALGYAFSHFSEMVSVSKKDKEEAAHDPEMMLVLNNSFRIKRIDTVAGEGSSETEQKDACDMVVDDAALLVKQHEVEAREKKVAESRQLDQEMRDGDYSSDINARGGGGGGDPAAASAAANVPVPLQPLAHLAYLCAEHFAVAPLDQLELFATVASLLHQPRLEQVTSLAERKVFCQVLDRFVEADPSRAASLVVDRLLKRWPTDCSERQVLFLTQLESVFKSSDDATIHALFARVTNCVARSVRHDNWHVANCAMTFGEKLALFAGPTIDKNPVEGKAVAQLLNSIETNISAHWNPAIQARAKELALRIRSALPSCS